MIKRIRNLLEEDQHAIVKNAFESFDTDKDGFLNSEEVKSATQALNVDVNIPQLAKVIESLNENEEKIDYEQFFYLSI